MTIYALIPARSGSKGVPMKNLKKVAGKSLVERAIDSAKIGNSGIRIFVSSDSPDIISLAITYGAEGHVRTLAAAVDEASANAVVEDFIVQKGLEKNDVILYLQPTSPLRNRKHVDDALQMYLASDRKPVTSVKLVEEHPAKMLYFANGTLAAYDQSCTPTANRQALQNVYIPNGAIYIFDVEDFQDAEGFPVIDSLPFLMSSSDSVDIDTELDLEVAHLLLSNKEARTKNDQ